MQKPNVIVIITDDQGYGDVGVHGNEYIKTPNLDRMAQEGIELSRFYTNPLCSPSRANLMTGRYCYRTGILHTSRGGALMSGEEVTAAEYFLQAGYRTGIFGKWHLGDNYPMRPMDQGFETAVWHKGGGIGQTPVRPNSYFDSWLYRGEEPFQAEGYCTDVFFDEALEFIEANREDPFFVYIPTNAPHTPLEISDRYADPYREMGLNDETARVYGMVENIDDNLGRLMERLDELGLDENTIVIYTSDHGGAGAGRYRAGFRAGKGTVYEGGIRVSFFMQYPGGLEGGKKIDRITAHIDVLPTLLDLCGLSEPADVDGLSLKPLMTGAVSPDAWPERTLFSQTHRGREPRWYHNCAAITQRYKLVGYPGTGEKWNFETSRTDPEVVLYDIEQDPGEEQDLADEKPEVVDQLRAAYEAWFEDVTRDWKPGTIHIGNEAENPMTLCRYQDSEYDYDLPRGWFVEIERGGDYEISINRGSLDGEGALGVGWQGQTQRQKLKAGEHTARFSLSEGEGRLEIWLELEGIGRIAFSSNEIIGDVEMKLL